MSLRSAVLRASATTLAVGLFGCSSANFDVASGGDDTGGVTDGGDLDTTPGLDSGNDVGTDVGTDVLPTDVGTDTSPPPIDGGPPPDAPVDAPSEAGGCSLVPTGGADVYVDATSKKPSMGSVDCPFHTIREATELAAPILTTRTIHVAGGSSAAPIGYNESGPVVVRNNVTLVGGGSAGTRITGGGSCPVGSGSCIVEVEPGGTIDGFSVLPAPGGSFSGNLVVLNNGLVIAPAKVKNLVVTGAPSGQGALVARGASDIGPGMNVSANGSNGLNVTGSGTVHVIGSSSGDNAFNTNGNNGINVDAGASATLVVDAATTNGNNLNGVRLANGSKHTLSKLVATANVNQGVVVFNPGSLVMKNSTLTGNKIGLVFIQSATSTLDIGISPDAGNNVFGGATAKNTLAGICVDIQHGQTFNGDSFVSCSPTSIVSSPCDGLSGSYNDVVYHSTTGATASVSACTVGP